ncbi:hypothetical protein O6H91_10G051200 [Diphasiastrum complanatum]|nr:hypothetical protein O6H91_10G051200 [Diphasiastrum complanatum]
MYGACGNLENARKMFDMIPRPNVFSWNAIVSAYARHGRSKECIQLFQHMLQKGVNPDNFTFVSVLHACGERADLAEGKKIHALVADSGLISHPFVISALVYMYGKCGNLDSARTIFNSLSKREVSLWNAMIAAYAENGDGKLAIQLFNQMQEEGVKPDRITFVRVLHAVSGAGGLPLAKSIHAQISKSGLELDLIVSTAVVNMYCKCGSLEDAETFFAKMPERDVVPWNIMISSYAQLGNAKRALNLFQQMQQEGVKPNKLTFISLTSAFACPDFLKAGVQLHYLIREGGFELDIFVGASLLDMYSNCGSLEDAYQMFQKMPERDVVLWNAMIAALANHGKSELAYQLLGKMQLENVKLDKFTFVSILDLCANRGDLERGTLVHAGLIEKDFEFDVIISNALITMYGKCGSLKEACRLFEAMPEQDIVSWNTMISAHAQHEECKAAVKLYRKMWQKQIKPNQFTFLGILDACARLMDLPEGEVIHSHIIDNGFELDTGVATALVNMYCKCGSLNDARIVFNKVPEKDVVLWSAIIAAYSQHGHGKEALNLFDQMVNEGCKPDAVTFISVLSACSHDGLIDKGYYYFKCMSTEYGIVPTKEHYGCMIDLFGRAGQLSEAESWMVNLPFEPSYELWTTLLGACRVYGDYVRGKRAAEHLLELDPSNFLPYVVLSNIYATAGRWEDVIKVKKLLDREVSNQLEFSSLQGT